MPPDLPSRGPEGLAAAPNPEPPGQDLGDPTAILRPITPDDLDAVLAIEALSLPVPWSRDAYTREITANPFAHYLVLAAADGQILGYGGLWVQVDELHVIVMAVHPSRRRRGLGARILDALIRHGMDLGCVRATLEVRAGNRAAQALYRDFGFREEGRRRGYYADNGEDALIMSTPPFDDPGWLGLWSDRQASGAVDEGTGAWSVASALMTEEHDDAD